MAAMTRISISPWNSIMIQRRTTASAKRCTTTTLAHSNTHETSISLNHKTPPPLLHITSSIKVFEDVSSGIVCYRDDKGEITCEGYDEGPRLQHSFSTFTSNHQRDRDAEVIELLQRRLRQIVDGSEVK